MIVQRLAGLSAFGLCRSRSSLRPLACGLKPRYSFIRPKSSATRTKTAAPAPAGKQYQFPERLLIYHAGTGRTVFVGCLKVTTIFVFAFFALVVTPAHYYATDEPFWITPLVLATGVIPFLFVSRASLPFVSDIHLYLPPYARHSRELIHRYSSALPANASLRITTMNVIGKPRFTKLPVSELQLLAKSSLIGGANYARVRRREPERKWWMGKGLREFAINNGGSNVREKGVWDNVARFIARNSKH